MSTKRTCELPARLMSLRRRFEDWRRTRKVRSRIPEPLWDSAVKLAGVYGLHRTAKALRVNYYALKERVEQKAAARASNRSKGDGATFLELAAPASSSSILTGSCECTLELEDAEGAKMRVRLSGVRMPDLVALSRSFWRAEP
ncbi:MAG: hypothetical protein ACC645_25640 [Pirellulales bacterium]